MPRRPEQKIEIKEIPKLTNKNIKLFNLWESNFEVKDPGLKRYINLNPIVIPKTQGRNVSTQFWRNKMHLVERLINKLMVVGHKGKSHRYSSGRNVGKTESLFHTVKEAFEKIEKKLGKNPIEVLLRAVENSAPREEVTAIEYGGARYPKAVECSPQRRVDLALRNIATGTYAKSFMKKKKASDALAEELIAAYQMNTVSNAIAKKSEVERQADSSR
ncbi:30S ribosomal protein S7 [Candidatus Woesearchaeota archaeon]|nr:30S ribosomal protein S7 [Candidatus Woesearchaeota archaeon]